MNRTNSKNEDVELVAIKLIESEDEIFLSISLEGVIETYSFDTFEKAKWFLVSRMTEFVYGRF